jgi:hypothetical protein
MSRQVKDRRKDESYSLISDPDLCSPFSLLVALKAGFKKYF